MPRLCYGQEQNGRHHPVAAPHSENLTQESSDTHLDYIWMDANRMHEIVGYGASRKAIHQPWSAVQTSTSSV